MSYLLISFLLISINCQNNGVQEKWKLNDIWNFFYKNISQREVTTYGLVDPNGYIRKKTGSQFEDYLHFLNDEFGVCMFITVIKKFDESNVTQRYVNVTSLRLFNQIEKTNFDINIDKLVSVIYSVEDKRYKINVGKDYRHKTNARMVYDIFENVESYLEEQKPFLVIFSIATKIEGFKNLNPEEDEEEEEEEEVDDSEYDDVRITVFEKEKEDNIKYNDSSKLSSFYLILSLATLFIITAAYFMIKRNKRIKKSKFLIQKNLDYNLMNSLNDV